MGHSRVRGTMAGGEHHLQVEAEAVLCVIPGLDKDAKAALVRQLARLNHLCVDQVQDLLQVLFETSRGSGCQVGAQCLPVGGGDRRGILAVAPGVPTEVQGQLPKRDSYLESGICAL